MPPFTASANCLASGLQASESTCGSVELTRLGATGLGVEVALVVGWALGVLEADSDGDGRIGARLTGSITAPWSTSDTAAIVPSGLKATGPSSVPGVNGNWFSTPSSGLRKYHAPVAKPRTAIRPSTPGAAPSVNRAGWAGGRVRTLI